MRKLFLALITILLIIIFGVNIYAESMEDKIPIEVIIQHTLESNSITLLKYSVEEEIKKSSIMHLVEDAYELENNYKMQILIEALELSSNQIVYSTVWTIVSNHKHHYLISYMGFKTDPVYMEIAKEIMKTTDFLIENYQLAGI
ncbi:MAG: hypothetical protein KGD67_13130 [Candidatus Lokiarchaeota archaeon]|nr:hypothetical protein [Candidatus Lokiarchaeota archaeon]